MVEDESKLPPSLFPAAEHLVGNKQSFRRGVLPPIIRRYELLLPVAEPLISFAV
ncbi:MAG: hypothetical protein HY675_27125 [Chloroflexi bacterium]|nr:hypothetical protein [Chloroflexota bacterium]